MSLDLEGQSPRSRRGRGRGSGDSENPRAARSAGRALVVFERKRWDARESARYMNPISVDREALRMFRDVIGIKKKKKPKEPLRRDRGGSNNTIESSVGGNVSR